MTETTSVKTKRPNGHTELVSMAGGSASEMETALIEHAHEMSMSSDPQQAIQGRLMKLAMPGFLQWIKGEIERGSSAEYMMRTSISGCVSQLGTLVTTLAQGDPRMERIGYTVVRELLLKQYDECAEDAKALRP